MTAVPAKCDARQRDLRWVAWLAGCALLIGTMFLCGGFVTGPGATYLFAPFPLVGLVAAFVIGVRKRRAGTSGFGQGFLAVVMFFVVMYVPVWLWWGWLEWKVRTIPVPPGTTSVVRSTGGILFDGRSDCQVSFEMAMTKAEIDALPRPGEEWRALLDYRNGEIQKLVAFYHKRMTSEGWKVKPAAVLPGQARIPYPNFVMLFTRDGETLSFSTYPNTFSVAVIVERADPLPPFGEVWIPGPPWASQPAPTSPCCLGPLEIPEFAEEVSP